MKKLLSVAVILVLAAPSVLAGPIVFLAPADWNMAADGAPAGNPVNLTGLPGDSFSIGVFVYGSAPTASNWNAWQLFAAGPAGSVVISDVAVVTGSGMQWMRGEVRGDGTAVYFDDMYMGGAPGGSFLLGTFTLTIDENVAMGSTFDFVFADDAVRSSIASGTANRFYVDGGHTGLFVGSDGYYGNLRVSVVPEPATLALLGIGLATLVGYRRKRS